MWKVLGALAILSCQILNAEEPQRKPIHLEAIGGLLDDCIDPTTGSWHDHEVDLIVPGTTLSLERHHSSSEPGWMATLCGEWHHPTSPPINRWARWGSNHSTLFYFLQSEESAFVQDVSGQHLKFNKNNYYRQIELAREMTQGWSNLRSVFAGARADTRNSKLSRSLSAPYWTLTTPQGIVRSFGAKPSCHSFCSHKIWMSAETKRQYPSGIQWHFQYEPGAGHDIECMWLKSIEERDRRDHKIADLTFYDYGNRVESQTGQWVEYDCVDSFNFKRLLKKVKRSFGASIEYEYFFPIVNGNSDFLQPSKRVIYSRPDPYPPRISKKQYESGKYRRMEYECDQGLPVRNWMRTTEECQGSVSAYYGPVGEEGKEEAIYRLTYTQRNTTVTHGDGKIEEYQVGGHRALSALLEFDKDKKFRREHRYYYHSQNEHVGRLQYKTLSNEQQQVIQHSTFEYDSKGNLTRLITKGALESRGKTLFVNPHGQIEPRSNCNTYTVEYKYSEAPFYLKTEEKYPTGKRIVYLHEPGTDKVSAKLLYQHDAILERHFFEYDDHGHVAVEIHDDGSALNSCSLEDVFHRVVIRRTYQNEGVLKGLLLEEKTYHLDVDTQEENPTCQFAYTYDSCRRLVCKNGTEFVLGGVTEHYYEYDERSNVIREIDERGAIIERSFEVDGLVKREKGPDARVEKFYSYDADRRLATCIETHADYPGLEWVIRYKYDVMGRVREIQDPYGVCITNLYDWGGRLIKQTRKGVLDETSSKLCEYSKEFKYDSDDRKIYERDESGFETVCEYNMLGKPLYLKNQEGKEEEYVYDLLGQLLGKVENGSHKEHYFYDVKGRHSSTKVEADGKLYTLASLEYKGAYKSSQIDALGHCDFWKYNALGNVIEHTRLDMETGAEVRTEVVYDGFGREIIKRLWQDGGDYTESHKRYNAAGDVIEKWVQNSLAERFDYESYYYDEVGRCIRVDYHLDQETPSSITEFDSLGNISLGIDQEGYQTCIAYTYLVGASEKGIAVITREYRPDGSLVEKGLTSDAKQVYHKLFDIQGTLRKHQIFGYNALGRVVYRNEQTLKTEGLSDSEENWVQTKVQYGPGGHVLKRWDNHQGSLERLRTWTYDSRGLCLRKTEPSGLYHEYSYDMQGYMTRCLSSDGSIDYSYVHDELGRTLKVTNEITGKSTIRKYDAWGRIIKDESEEGFIFERKWSALGQPTKDVYPSGHEVIREYKGGLLRSAHVDNYTQEIRQYNSQGLTIIEEQPLGLGQILSHFDCKKRLTDFEMPGYSANGIIYNEMGHLTHRQLGFEQTQSYEYDLLGQLKKEAGLCERIYEHDSRSRRIAQDEKQIALDDLDQLLAITEPLNSQHFEQFDYDEDGHLTKRVAGEDVWQYTYDAWSRLVKVQGPTFTASYSYDAFNRRMRAIHETPSGVKETKFAYLGQMLAGIYDENGIDERYFVRSISSERGDTFIWRHNDSIYFPIHDMSGSCIGWRESNGEITSSWAFDSFGTSIGRTQGPWGCWGKYKDPITDMVYFGVRDYIPSQGRWLTRDPKGEIDGSNLYGYVGNNPVTRCDDWGTSWQGFKDYFSGSHEFKTFEWGAFLSNRISMEYAGFDPKIYDAHDDFLNEVSIVGKSSLTVSRYNECDTNPRGVVIEINGLHNSYQDVVKQTINTSREAKCDVYHVHNASNMFYDGLKALLQRNGFDIVTGAEKLTIEALKLAQKEHPGKEILIKPHSHGNQVMANVVEMAKGNPELDPILQRCHVRAMAGSGVIENPHSLASCKNTVCTNDWIIRCFDGGAIDKQRELGILDEPNPTGNFFENLIPDHTLNSETCTNAFSGAIKFWGETI